MRWALKRTISTTICTSSLHGFPINILSLLIFITDGVALSMRLYPKDPSFTVGEKLLMWCTFDDVPCGDVYFSCGAETQNLSRVEYLRNFTKVSSPNKVQLELEASMEWNGILINCCHKNSCRDQQKVLICLVPPLPRITTYKIFDWSDLIFSWDESNRPPGIKYEAFYKASSDENFTKCSQTEEDACREKKFYEKLKRTDDDVELKVVARNVCGRERESEVIRKHLENIVETRPVENLAFFEESNSSSVILNFSVRRTDRSTTARLQCSCDKENFHVEVNITVEHSRASFTLQNLPVNSVCQCDVRVRSLGWWSERKQIVFSSPLDVPSRNPEIVGYHVDRSTNGYPEVTILFEHLNRSKSGDVEFLIIKIMPEENCFIAHAKMTKIYQIQPNCSQVINFECSLTIATPSPTLNISLTAMNKAGPCKTTDYTFINIEKEEVIQNLSMILREDKITQLSWNFKSSLLPPASVVVLCCFFDNFLCKELEWKSVKSTTRYEVNSSLILKNIRYGVGAKVDDEEIPQIILINEICFINAVPLPPILELVEVKQRSVSINYHQPACNKSGYAYKHIFRMSKVNYITNRTEEVEEKVLSAKNPSDMLTFEIPDNKLNYQIESMSIAHRGLSEKSKVLKVSLNEPNGSNDNYYWIAFIFFPLLLLIIWYVARNKCRQTDVKIELPQEPLRTSWRDDVSNSYYADQLEDNSDRNQGDGASLDDRDSENEMGGERADDSDDHKTDQELFQFQNVEDEEMFSEVTSSGGHGDNFYSKCCQSPASLFFLNSWANPILTSHPKCNLIKEVAKEVCKDDSNDLSEYHKATLGDH